MFPEVIQQVDSLSGTVSSQYQHRYFVQLYRAFLPTVYLHTDGVWTEDITNDSGRAYFDTPEDATKAIEEYPYVGISYSTLPDIFFQERE